MLHRQIHEYGHVQNGHGMLVTYIHNVHIENSEHRNLEIRKHVTTSLFRYETFLLLLSFDTRREIQSFYAGFFIWPLSRVAPMACKFVAPQRTPKVEPPRSASNFNSLNFLQIPKILRALPVDDVTRTSSPVSSSQAIVTSLSERALPPASRLHLTNPCAEPKGSQPN